MIMKLNPVPDNEDIAKYWQDLTTSQQKALKSTKVRPVNVHYMTLEVLNDLNAEDFSKDEKEMEDIEWENADEEMSEEELARIHSSRVRSRNKP